MVSCLSVWNGILIFVEVRGTDVPDREGFMLRTILTILFILVCLALSTIVLAQEGKSAGLGAISGAAETYWGKNKGRSMEGKLVMITRILAVAFMVFTILLNLKRF